jgi:serine/threonine protein kinase/tetratricopeptide (TPR) repeat protein
MTHHPHDPASREDSIRKILADWGAGGGDDDAPHSLDPEVPFSWTNLTDHGNPGPAEYIAGRLGALSEAIVADFGLDARGVDEIHDRPTPEMLEVQRTGGCASTTHRHGNDPRSADLGRERSWPGPNDVVGGFQIILELGRGAFARVFLAAELNLGHRLVAIKLSQPEGNEPQILAQLQHTHIVPVHSVCSDQNSGLRILCMPYFGGANLAEVLWAAGGLEPTLRDGRSLVEALDHVGRTVSGVPSRIAISKTVNPPSARSVGSPSFSAATAVSGAKVLERSATNSRFRSLFSRLIRPWPSAARSLIHDPAHLNQPFRQYLHGASAIQAAVWITARLAEGLEHAHARGLLHRDLKPSNILLASDGTPMLLDFNLAARAPTELFENEARHALIGGTLPYMSPEHLDAFNPRGSTLPEAVDERSDIYAIGLILYEMLAGERPFTEPPANRPMVQALEEMIAARRHPPSLRRHSPKVPWSLDALVAKCMSFDPARRYACAGDLAEDLRRFLENQPMKHCAEPSLRERLGKLARRHPALCSATSITIICGILIGVLVGTTVLVYDKMEHLAARVRLRVFDRDFTDCQFLLNTVSGSRDHLKSGLRKARGTLRGLGVDAGIEPLYPEWLRRLTSDERIHVREQLSELVMLEARGASMLANQRGTDRERRDAYERALARLDLAMKIAPKIPGALYAERALYYARLGDADLAEDDNRRAASIPPATCHDQTLLGSTLLANGDHARAEEALRQALKIDVESFWAWFLLGHCRYDQRRFLEAAGAFSVCASRGPTFSWAHFNRGLALAKAGRLVDAQDAYDAALKIDPDFPEALANRALVELELNQPEHAQADLERAIALGRDDVAILAALGEALARQGRRDDAEQYFGGLLARDPACQVALVARGIMRLTYDLQSARGDLTRALAIDPDDAHAHYGMALAIRRSDPQEALRHLDMSLKSNPSLTDAVQLRALVRARMGKREALDDVDRLIESPTCHRLYNAACAIAVYAGAAGDRRPLRHGLELLARALESGFPAREAAVDPDLEAMHGLPEYMRLMAQYFPPAPSGR